MIIVLGCRVFHFISRNLFYNICLNVLVDVCVYCRALESFYFLLIDCVISEIDLACLELIINCGTIYINEQRIIMLE